MLKLILDDFFPLDVKYVADQIQLLTLEEAQFGRYGGVCYKANADGTDILAWQCNVVDVQNCDVSLPTIISLRISKNRRVIKADLHDNFKGSQGVPCMYRYLNNRMKKLIIGENFSLDNIVFKDQTVFYCRHIYELVFGSCAFYNHYISLGIQNAYISESTGVYSESDTLKCLDRISVVGNCAETRIDFSGYKDKINFGLNGSIEKVDGLKISGFSIEKEKTTMIKDLQKIEAQEQTEFVMKTMKTLNPYWKSSGKKIGVDRGFYFSHLWPPSLFGILTQSLGLSLFNKNFTYFQHCIYGLQHNNNGKPLCIGVINNVSEGQRFFEDLTLEDFSTAY